MTSHLSRVDCLSDLLDTAGKTPVLGDLSAQVVLERITETGRRLFGVDGLGGAIVALPLDNSVESLEALLAIGALGGAALIVSPKASAAEREALLARGSAVLWFDHDDEPTLRRLNGTGFAAPGSVLIPTSGSTGEAKIVTREIASLVSEGLRYTQILAAKPGMRVAFAAPVAHAYALGWFAGCLAGNWQAVPHDPVHLGVIAREIMETADWTVATPAIVRLLALRPLPFGDGAARSPGRVMVGAGPVTADLLAAFSLRFGIGLARNFGSTETGAVFCSLDSPPPSRIGRPMPGVRFRLVDETGIVVEGGRQGLLEVDVGTGWHAMGDLVSVDLSGDLVVLGRASEAVRRGDRWIATAEVESLVAGFPRLRAVKVRKGEPRPDGCDRLALDLWPVDPATFPLDEFREYLTRRLGPEALPEQSTMRLMLKRGDGGKIVAPKVWRRGKADALAKAMRAYKRSELLFALASAGVLDLLGEGRSADAIAADLGGDAGMLEALLALAETYGLVSSGPVGANHEAQVDVDDLVSFEALASRGIAARERIAELLTWGFSRADPLSPGSAQSSAYLAAMVGPAAKLRAKFGVRALNLVSGARLLEIATGPEDYCSQARRRDSRVIATHIAVGPAGGGLAEPLPPAAYDAVVVVNAVRFPPVADRIGEIAAALVPGGTLLIDDLFFDGTTESADFAIDWLTHGGSAFFTIAELIEHLAGYGLDATAIPIPGIAAASLVRARAPTQLGGQND